MTTLLDADAVSLDETILDTTTPQNRLGHSRSGVTSAVVGDLASAICEAIRSEVGMRVSQFDVEMIGSEVVLSGSVRSFYVKQMITHAVLPVLSDHTLTNAIRVKRV